MLFRNIAIKTLWDQRKSMLGWVIGINALTVITVLFYPSFQDMTEINAMLGDEDSFMRTFVGDVTDLTSPEGFMNSQLYYIMVPLILIAFGITQGGGAIAGEEEHGTLDLLLANPVKRSTVFLQKFAALTASLIFLSFTLWLGTILSVLTVNMDISLVRLGEITFSGTLLALLFGTMALTVGGIRANRGLTSGLASGLAVLSYLVNALVPIEKALEPFSKFSPFYYYIHADPLTNGIDWIHASILILATAAILVIGMTKFTQRDIGV